MKVCLFLLDEFCESEEDTHDFQFSILDSHNTEAAQLHDSGKILRRDEMPTM